VVVAKTVSVPHSVTLSIVVDDPAEFGFLLFNGNDLLSLIPL
jgi:hypothetical protein